MNLIQILSFFIKIAHDSNAKAKSLIESLSKLVILKNPNLDAPCRLSQMLAFHFLNEVAEGKHLTNLMEDKIKRIPAPADSTPFSRRKLRLASQESNLTR